MAASLPITFMILLSLLSLSSSLPSDTIVDASEILTDSGYVSMALTLQLVSQTLTLKSSALSIFAPPDAAFSKSGQPALSHLQYHSCPLPLSLQSLKSLAAGTKIPTLLSGNVLNVTSSPSDSQISLNNVKITSSSPIFHDESLIIFGVEDFFDPNFHVPGSIPNPSPRSDSICDSSPSEFPGSTWFKEASENLRSNGYSIMASFLDLQLLGFDKERSAPITVFAPNDQALSNRREQDSSPSIFLRHVVPCRLLWSDLVSLSDGTVLPTYSEGFTINVTGSGNILMLNGTPVFFANMNYSDSLAVHGLNEVLTPQEAPESGADSSAGSDGMKIEDIMLMENIKF